MSNNLVCCSHADDPRCPVDKCTCRIPHYRCIVPLGHKGGWCTEWGICELDNSSMKVRCLKMKENE